MNLHPSDHPYKVRLLHAPVLILRDFGSSSNAVESKLIPRFVVSVLDRASEKIRIIEVGKSVLNQMSDHMLDRGLKIVEEWPDWRIRASHSPQGRTMREVDPCSEKGSPFTKSELNRISESRYNEEWIRTMWRSSIPSQDQLSAVVDHNTLKRLQFITEAKQIAFCQSVQKALREADDDNETLDWWDEDQMGGV